MQAASPAAPKRRLRQRARLLVQGIDAAPAAEQTETGFDAGRVAPRVQADRQSAVIVVAPPLSAPCRLSRTGPGHGRIDHLAPCGPLIRQIRSGYGMMKLSRFGIFTCGN